MPKKLKVGRIYPTKNSGDIRILERIGCSEVRVQYLNTNHIQRVCASAVHSRSLKDPLQYSVCGVGFIGVGKFRPKLYSKAYSRWRLILARCYNTKRKASLPTYDGCSVVSEWRNFQNFAKWFEEHYVEGYHIDKDIKVEGNKVYSPEFCSFVSPQENTEKSAAKHYQFLSPCGKVTSVYNLSKFCRENHLQRTCMRKLHEGGQNYHRGWRAVEDEL